MNKEQRYAIVDRCIKKNRRKCKMYKNKSDRDSVVLCIIFVVCAMIFHVWVLFWKAGGY